MSALPPSEDDAIERCAEHLRSFAGSDAARAALALLKALELRYKDKLLEVTPEQLSARQAATKQLIALQRVLRGEDHAIGSI